MPHWICRACFWVFAGATVVVSLAVGLWDVFLRMPKEFTQPLAKRVSVREALGELRGDVQ